MWLDKCLKSPVVEAPSTSNMVNEPKHRAKLNDSTFTIFIDPSEGSSGWKTLSESYAKSYACLLTPWLPITSIVFLIETIYSKIFRCNYLRNEKYFLIFFAFSKFRWNFEHFQNKDDPHSWCIFELTDPEKRGEVNV